MVRMVSDAWLNSMLTSRGVSQPRRLRKPALQNKGKGKAVAESDSEHSGSAEIDQTGDSGSNEYIPSELVMTGQEEESDAQSRSNSSVSDVKMYLRVLTTCRMR